MLLPAERFSFSAPLERAFPIFLRELCALPRERFVPWSDRAAYGGTWLTFPLQLPDRPSDYFADCARNEALCPESIRALRAIRGFLGGGFSWMEPACHIYKHTDKPNDGVLRAHLGLRVPEGSLIRVGTTMATWQEGKCLLFDGQLEHETANLGASPRVVLLADFALDDAERAMLRSSSC